MKWYIKGHCAIGWSGVCSCEWADLKTSRVWLATTVISLRSCQVPSCPTLRGDGGGKHKCSSRDFIDDDKENQAPCGTSVFGSSPRRRSQKSGDEMRDVGLRDWKRWDKHAHKVKGAMRMRYKFLLTQKAWVKFSHNMVDERQTRHPVWNHT